MADEGRERTKSKQVSASTRRSHSGSTIFSSSGSRTASSGDVELQDAQRYDSYVGARHLDVGVGTGWFLDHCKWRVENPRISLLDLNDKSLSAASGRIRRDAPETLQANVLDPVDFPDARFDSIGGTSSSIVFPADWSGRPRQSRRTSVPTSPRAVSSSEARFSAAASPTTCSDDV